MDESLVSTLSLNDSSEAPDDREERFGPDDVTKDWATIFRLLQDGIDPDIWRWKPVPVKDWILGKEYLNMKETIRQPVMDDIVGFFKHNEADPWNRDFDEGVFCEGIGSGKSFKTSCIATYFLHLLLCLRNPQRFFHSDQSSKLAIMNMCFAGDQVIRKVDGTEVTFKELFDSQEQIEVTAYDVGRQEFKRVMANPVTSSGVQKVKRIQMGNGRTLRLTDTHPLLTRDKDSRGRYTNKAVWKKVSELKDGDIVKVGAYLADGRPSGFSSDEIKLLAYILGDSKIFDSGIQFISSYKRVVTDFKETAKKFGVVKFREHDKGDLHCVVAESPQIIELVNKAGVRENEGERELPPALIQGAEEEVALFLNRIWATYGSVNIGHKLSINFTNPSLKLVRGICDMLTRFGIISRYYTNDGKYKKEMNAQIYRVSISDTTSKQIFIDKIGRCGLHLEGCQMVKGNMGKRFEWTNIEKISQEGEEETFDIEVPELHNLVVNGIVCHNSISERNARAVIFSEIRSKILNSDWFNARPWECEDARVFDPNCMSELRFKNNIYIIPGSSSWRSAVGYNIIVGIMDEAGSYRATDNSDQAEDIYLALKRRLGSRFENRGAVIIAGSPMYESDFLETKVSEAEKGKNPRVMAVRRPLWESKYHDWKGEFFYVDRVARQILDEAPQDMTNVDKIPKIPFLYEAFQANATKAYRDFGARPSPTLHAFFENPKVVLEMVNKARREDPVGIGGRFKPWFKPYHPSALHACHVDLALSGDACGIAVGHYGGVTSEGGVKVVIDLMLRMTGTRENKIEIARVRDYIYALSALGFKFGIITYDGWQSSDSIQILQRKGYRAEVLSVDKTPVPYNDLKEAINQGRLDYYMVPSGDSGNPSASEVFVKEAMQLEEIEGKKVDHPPKGSKDVSDAVAGVVHHIVKNNQSFIGVQAKII